MSINQVSMVTAKGEIVLHLSSQHKLCVLQRPVVQQPVQFRPLCWSIAVLVLDDDAVDGNGRAIREPGFHPVGVHAFINKLTDGEGVNVIFEAAGVPALLAHATSQLSPAGRLVAMTFGKEPIPVNFKEINAKELTILGTRHQYQKFPEVVKILPDHLKEVDEITTHVFKAEDFQKAFDTLADRNSGAGKVVLTFA